MKKIVFIFVIAVVLFFSCGTSAVTYDTANPPKGAIAVGFSYPDYFPNAGKYLITGIVNIYNVFGGKMGTDTVDVYADVDKNSTVFRLLTMQNKVQQQRSNSYNWQTNQNTTTTLNIPYQELDDLWGYIIPINIKELK